MGVVSTVEFVQPYPLSALDDGMFPLIERQDSPAGGDGENFRLLGGQGGIDNKCVHGE